MADRFVAAVRADRDTALELFEAEAGIGKSRKRSSGWQPDLVDLLHVEMRDDGGSVVGSVVIDCRLRARRDGRVDVVAPTTTRGIGSIDAAHVLALEQVLQVPTDTAYTELLYAWVAKRVVLVERDATGIRSVRDLTDDERARYIDDAAPDGLLRAIRVDAVRAAGIRSWGFTMETVDEWRAEQAKRSQQNVVNHVARMLLDGLHAVDGAAVLRDMRMRDKRVDAKQTIALPHELGEVMAFVGDRRGEQGDAARGLTVAEVFQTSKIDTVDTDGKVRRATRFDLVLQLTPDSEQQARIDKYGTRWATGLGVAVEAQSIAVGNAGAKQLHAAAMELVSAYSMNTVRVLAAIGIAAHESPAKLVEASPKAIAEYLGLDYRAMARKDKDALAKHIALAASICVQVVDPDTGDIKASMPMLVREMTRLDGGKAVPMLGPSRFVWDRDHNHVPREWLHLDPVKQSIEMRLIWGVCQRYSRAIGQTVARGEPTPGMTTALSHLTRGDLILERLRESKGTPAVQRRLEQAFKMAAGIGVIIERVEPWQQDPLTTKVNAVRSVRLFMAEDARRGEALALAAKQPAQPKQLTAGSERPNRGRRRLPGSKG